MHLLAQCTAALSFLLSRVVADAPLIHDYDGYNAGTYREASNQTYVSTSIVSPLFQVTTWDRAATDPSKYIFLGLKEPGQANAPLNFSSADLSLIWADPQYSFVADVGIQQFNNSPVLVVGQGIPVGFHSKGSCMLLDHSYSVIYNVSVPELTPGLDSDLHKCRITADDTMLITTYTTKPWDLSSVGGLVNDTIVDAGFAEVDIVTGKVLFSWTATDHFGLNESFLAYSAGGWDWFHVNSVQKTSSGDYMISCHSIKAIVLITKTDGTPVWFLGGAHNEFRDLSGGNATNFGFQHDAVFQNAAGTLLTMFDNQQYAVADAGCTENCSRGLELAIDYGAKTVRVAKELWHPASLASIALGGMQVLPNGNFLVCWGANPGITEHRPDGTVVCNFRFAPWSSDTDILGIGFNYRTYKQDWVAHPPWAPNLVVTGNGSAASVAYVSWKGHICLVEYPQSMPTETGVPREVHAAAARIALLLGERPETIADRFVQECNAVAPGWSAAHVVSALEPGVRRQLEPAVMQHFQRRLRPRSQATIPRAVTEIQSASKAWDLSPLVLLAEFSEAPLSDNFWRLLSKLARTSTDWETVRTRLYAQRHRRRNDLLARRQGVSSTQSWAIPDITAVLQTEEKDGPGAEEWAEVAHGRGSRAASVTSATLGMGHVSRPPDDGAPRKRARLAQIDPASANTLAAGAESRSSGPGSVHHGEQGPRQTRSSRPMLVPELPLATAATENGLPGASQSVSTASWSTSPAHDSPISQRSGSSASIVTCHAASPRATNPPSLVPGSRTSSPGPNRHGSDGTVDSSTGEEGDRSPRANRQQGESREAHKATSDSITAASGKHAGVWRLVYGWWLSEDTIYTLCNSLVLIQPTFAVVDPTAADPPTVVAPPICGPVASSLVVLHRMKPSNHWVLGVISRLNKTVSLYHALPNPESNASAKAAVHCTLAKILPSERPADWAPIVQSCPLQLQQNGADGGVAVVALMLYCLLGRVVPSSIDFMLWRRMLAIYLSRLLLASAPQAALEAEMATEMARQHTASYLAENTPLVLPLPSSRPVTTAGETMTITSAIAQRKTYVEHMDRAISAAQERLTARRAALSDDVVEAKAVWTAAAELASKAEAAAVADRDDIASMLQDSQQAQDRICRHPEGARQGGQSELAEMERTLAASVSQLQKRHRAAQERVAEAAEVRGAACAVLRDLQTLGTWLVNSEPGRGGAGRTH